MAARRRGARTGRGWDAAPPRARRAAEPEDAAKPEDAAEPDTPEGRPRHHKGRNAAAPTEATPDPPRDPAEVAREICLRQLAVRPRTRVELATALRRHGIADDVATDVLDRYDEVGMIDDEAFARAWVTSRHHGQGLARRALATELRRRGVAAETVGAALEELDRDTEAETARTLVDRRLRTIAGAPPETLMRRLVGMLARKGYPAGLAFRVVKEALAADERTAEVADQLDPDVLAEAAVGDTDLSDDEVR